MRQPRKKFTVRRVVFVCREECTRGNEQFVREISALTRSTKGGTEEIKAGKIFKENCSAGGSSGGGRGGRSRG